MRFESLRTVRFGALRDREFDLAAPILLVEGPNEAGKSCFHAALETILYGFDPASRDTHPYAVWETGAGDLHLEAQLITDSGDRLAVERVLQSAGTVRLDRTGEGFHGPRSASGNRPLPELDAIPRALFRAVYSLTSNDTHVYRVVQRFCLSVGICVAVCGRGIRVSSFFIRSLNYVWQVEDRTWCCRCKHCCVGGLAGLRPLWQVCLEWQGHGQVDGGRKAQPGQGHRVG